MLTQGDIIKIVIAFTMPDNVVAQLVTHYIVGAGSDVAISDALDDIETALGNAWDETAGNVADVVLGDTIKMSLWDATLKQFDEVASKATALFDGTNIGEMLPHGVAPVVRFFTAVGRRQGRKFIPGLVEGAQDEGDIGAGEVTALSSFALLKTTDGQAMTIYYWLIHRSFDDNQSEVGPM